MVFPFDRLRERLLTAGVSPRHVRRYMAELSDHVIDLETEAKRAGHPEPAASALERLGKPDDLAKAMIDRTELRAWTARAPWLVFLIAPSLAVAAIDLMTIVGIMLIVKLILPQAGDQTAVPVPHWFAALSAAINIFHAYGVSLLLGAGVILIAVRQRMPPLWPIVGLVAVAVLGTLNQLHIDVPVAPHQHGEVSLGAGISAPVAFRIGVDLLLMLPLYFAWRRWQPALTRPL
jgi:hypothetical protein